MTKLLAYLAMGLLLTGFSSSYHYTKSSPGEYIEAKRVDGVWSVRTKKDGEFRPSTKEEVDRLILEMDLRVSSNAQRRIEKHDAVKDILADSPASTTRTEMMTSLLVRKSFSNAVVIDVLDNLDEVGASIHRAEFLAKIIDNTTDLIVMRRIIDSIDEVSHITGREELLKALSRKLLALSEQKL
ncbi:hypothetical protein [Pseudobacteriovorax antillogorgiicola]|uniref:Uncharacterized protein n=1 Tax=Pseudobacteriovorax antillogorgiicola TaxID=1513793 RepID=A0A1Y6C8V2_9BACT|nr:hypothetical protein [Pseudobacteriovorax antillogorgiicola]TCS51744.1 hypothetical protein EDD56_110129 [Pseudobacteriovorax antillogorgiicola]SMF49659.1 hypothetical protein SAMN06296036_11598 [Pseudobacteriovorax antillogorgiicola]